jgi:hypothetical protein
VAVITKLVKGFDPDYPWKQMGAAAGDYFLVKGELRGRWWGTGAAELGLEPGSEVDRKAYRQLIAEHLDPRDGDTCPGRAPGNAAARAEALYQDKLKAEPHATLKRQFELRREAAREARQGPAYLELDNAQRAIKEIRAVLAAGAESLSGGADARSEVRAEGHARNEMRRNETTGRAGPGRRRGPRQASHSTASRRRGAGPGASG